MVQEPDFGLNEGQVVKNETKQIEDEEKLLGLKDYNNFNKNNKNNEFKFKVKLNINDEK